MEIVELSYFDDEKILSLISKCSICINLIGILYEKKPNQFKYIHSEFPSFLSKISTQEKIDQFIHISSLGIQDAKDSNYAMSKVDGEIFREKKF